MEKVAQTNEKAQAQVNEKAAAKDAAKEAEFKAKKAASAKKFAENQKIRKENLVKFSKELIEKKLIEKLSPEAQKFFNDAANPASHTGGFGGASFLNKVFGATPKVGDKITLLDYMKKTMESRAKLDKYVKDWATKGIVVEVKEAANQLETTYTITKLA